MADTQQLEDPLHYRQLADKLRDTGSSPSTAALILLSGFVLVQVFIFRTQLRAESKYVVTPADAGSTYFVVHPSRNQWIFTATLVLFVVGAVIYTGFYRRWMFWQPANESNLRAVLIAALAVALLIEAFAGTSALLAQRGWIDVSKFRTDTPSREIPGSHRPLRVDTTDPKDAEIWVAMESVYAWNFLDAVPALKIPDTVAWESPGHKFEEWRGGLLLLLFKVLVILPVIHLVVQLFTGSPSGQNALAGAATMNVAPPSRASR